jgi:quercetin dioxygenase-like cupin family protein
MTEQPVDLAGLAGGSGPLWGMQSDDLNATLLAWPSGGGVAEHTNDQLEVIMVVIEGSALVTVGGVEHPLATGQLLRIPRGRARAIAAGPRGVRYLSVHRRRGPLLPTSRIRESSQ